ncbi:MAG: hypothetical protein RL379_338 [Bacillota bacterium]|jgi:hypothetical protein
MNRNLDNTLEIVLENGKAEIFYIYFTFIFKNQNYVIYYHPSSEDDLYVKEYDDLTQELKEPSEEALQYAETMIANYEEETDEDNEKDGN